MTPGKQRHVVDRAQHLQHALSQREERRVAPRQGYCLRVEDELSKPLAHDLVVAEQSLKQRRQEFDVEQRLVDINTQIDGTIALLSVWSVINFSPAGLTPTVCTPIRTLCGVFYYRTSDLGQLETSESNCRTQQ